MSVAVFFYNFKNKSGLFDLIKNLDPTKLWQIRVNEYNARTLEQNSKIHAILNDISHQSKHLNQALDIDSWKRLCVKQFADDCIEQNIPRLADYWRNNSVKLIPSIDGRSLVALGQQTREFPKYVAAGFITWLEAYCVNNNIELHDNYVFDEKYYN
ncbi:MAG: recombination protein NinB [Paludibacter sp.]|nr:recombination protein NinB [Paludibacter sp.]